MMLRIFRHFIPASTLLLALSEFLLLFLVWHFYFLGGGRVSLNGDLLIQSPALALTVMAGAVMVISGLYQAEAFLDFRMLVIHIVITLIILCILTIISNAFFFFFFFTVANQPWVVDWSIVLTWLVCILLTRTAYLQLAKCDIFKSSILVLGTGHKAARIVTLATGQYNRQFVPIQYLRWGAETQIVSGATTIDEDGVDALAERAKALGATEIVVATDDRRGLPINQLLRCKFEGIRVTDYLDFIERQTKMVDLAAVQPGWLVFSDGLRGSASRRMVKRSFDLLSSLLLLLVMLPLMLLTAMLIVLDSRGPALYRQERVGLGGRPFVLLKFRSMRVDAEKGGIPQWANNQDSRVTRVGRFIRKLRIDELPQLLNVLRGDMSLVGPRPERPAFVNEFVNQIPFYAERHFVKPGITGWAQVNYPYGASFQDACNKMAYDLYYVKNQGLFLDLVILLQTVRVILWTDGAR